MARLAPAYYSTNARAHTVPELLRIHGWINTAWFIYWKFTGKPVPESSGHLVPCYWENMRCRAEDLSEACLDAAEPLRQAARSFADHWEIHYSRRPSTEPIAVDWGTVTFFSPGTQFAAQAVYALMKNAPPMTTFYASTFMRSGHAIVTSSHRDAFPICRGSELRFHCGTPKELLADHHRAVAKRRDIRVCDTFSQWIEAYDEQTELQSRWELERGLWIPMR